MIELRCPCGYSRPIPELYDGPDIKCPNCGKAMPIPVKPPPPPLPMKPVLGAMGAFLLIFWIWMQSAGFLCEETLDLSAFDTARPTSQCAYRSCGDPAKGPVSVRVSFVPTGITAPVYEDRSIPLCDDHAECAADRTWPSESSTWLKHPLQLLLSIMLSLLLIGMPCLVLHMTGRYSLPKILTGKTRATG